MNKLDTNRCKGENEKREMAVQTKSWTKSEDWAALRSRTDRLHFLEFFNFSSSIITTIIIIITTIKVWFHIVEYLWKSTELTSLISKRDSIVRDFGEAQTIIYSSWSALVSRTCIVMKMYLSHGERNGVFSPLVASCRRTSYKLLP